MLVIDPVCGIEVDSEDTYCISEYKGQVFYFDSPACQHEFEQDPEMFVRKISEKVYDEHGDRIDGSE